MEANRKMENIVDLRNELIELFDNLKNKRISANEAKELNNTCGKIINASKIELEYHIHLNVKRQIDFLESDI